MKNKFKLIKVAIGFAAITMFITPFVASCKAQNNKDDDDKNNNDKNDIRELLYHEDHTADISRQTMNLNQWRDWSLSKWNYDEDYGICFYIGGDYLRANFLTSDYGSLDKPLLKEMCDRFDVTYDDGGY